MNHHSSTPPDRYWSPGDHILIRHRRRGRVRHAWPVTVVHDGPDYSALYLRPGTPVKPPVVPNGSPVPRDMPYAEAARVPHQIGDDAWRWRHMLEIVQEGDAYGIAFFWSEAEWAFRGWYVNLQDPVIRAPTGFDTADHVLDVQVAPDGTPSWKDEQELAEAIRIGRFSQPEADAIRAAGEAVIPDIDGRFTGGASRQGSGATPKGRPHHTELQGAALRGWTAGGRVA